MVRHQAWVAGLALLVALGGTAARAQQGTAGRGWTPPRTPWGHPDLSGVFTNKDEANTPLERPQEFAGRDPRTFTAEELAALARQRQTQAAEIAGGIGGAETGAGPTHWYEHLQGKGSRPWFIVDPADGKVPALTPQAARREAAFARLNDARNGEGRADSWEDRSMYDRCITRGLPGSMMPAIYGNAYQILQTPDAVAIRYEMIHETRVIPLDGRPHLASGVRQWLGDARGRFEGNTLVVETTNFTDRTRYNSERFRLVERFTPVAPDRLLWEVTFDDPDVYVRPWTFAMQLTRDDEQQIYEYACHEGNRGLEHILKGARSEERGR
jgi:hypothetical protein